MMFFLIVVVAIYASVNTKIQKQQKELNSIQKSYEQEKIDDIYQKKYNEYLEKETSTIQVYADTILKGEVIGKNKNTIGTVYTDVVQNKIKIFGGANSTYAYSETADGKRNVLSGNEITIQATTSGKTIYTWLKGEDGKYTKYYTALTVKLSTLQDKTIYVAEEKTTDIGEISGQNKGKITYSQIDANHVSIENDKVTGIKAGDTTIIATESNGGAQAKITIKIVKLTLEKTKGITTVGDNKKIQVSGINNGTISAKSNDETIAKVTVNGTEVTVIPQNVGNAKIIITENNAGANIEYEIQVVGITLAPNGGTYTMPTTGKATIRTKVKVENASKIEVAWTSAKLEWKTIENNSETIKNDCEKGTYYLYVKIDNEYLYQSQAFIVGEEKIAIAIKTSTTTWTNQNITVTITYPSVTTSSTRKAGYGTTLANAQTAATSATAPTTSVTVTANGYVYATATDTAGNVITASKQITNIDKVVPTVILSPNGGSYAKPTSGNATIKTTITAADTGGSGLKTLQYAWSTSNTTEPTTWTTFTNGATVSKTDCVAGTYYLWTKVYDNAGNRATTIKVSVGFIVGIQTITINQSTTTWTNQNITVTITYPSVTTSSTRKAGYGTTLANAQTAATSATAPTTSVTVTANGYVYATATDTAGNVITASKQITNIDKVVPTVILSPNGGSYAKPTSGNATIKTTITAADTGGSGLKTLQYAWSTSNTTEPTTWTTFTNGATVSKTDCVAGTYYLWTKVYDNAGNRATTIKVSVGFIVGIQTITINQSTTTWTNQNITVTITYPSVTTSSTRKAGYGTTLANAQTAATSATAPTTSVTVTANGYVYATATDTAGNVITASRQITNIDKTAPEISEFSAKASTTISTSATITVKAKDGLSGLSNLVLEWGTNTNYGNKKSESCLINGKGATDLTTKTISLTDLSANTTYYVKITISDVSGNVKTSTSSFTTGKAIAETNNVLYTSIQNALDSIEKQGTVKVLSDTTENVNIDTEKTITVNLNSKTITGFLRNWGTTTVYGGNITEKSETLGLGHAIENYGGKLTITSGTYTGYYQGVYQPSAEEGAKTGEIIIEGGNYYGTGKDGTGIALKQGNCLIKKGYFKGTVGGAAGWDYSPTITVQNGEFYGEQYGIFINSGTLDIKDGYFEGTDYAAVAIENSKSLSISGGKFYAKTVAGVYTFGCDNLYITNGYFKGSESSGIASYYTKYVNISNGEFVGYNNGIYMHDGTTATISGGKFSGYLSGLAIRNSTITITEGTFTGDTVDALSLYKSTGEIKGGVFTGKNHGGYNNNGSFTITGGTFRGNVEDGLLNEEGTTYINGGTFSGYKWGINSPSGKIWYHRTDGQSSDNNYVSSEGWPAVTASDLSFY